MLSSPTPPAESYRCLAVMITCTITDDISPDLLPTIMYLGIFVARWEVHHLVSPARGLQSRGSDGLISVREAPDCPPGVAGGRHLLHINPELAGRSVVSATDVVESQLVASSPRRECSRPEVRGDSAEH